MKAAEAQVLFDRNASNYAPVNGIISVGLDRRWRRWVADRAIERPGQLVLDAMTGTGDVAVELAKREADVVAADVSSEMLAVAGARMKWIDEPVDLVVADMMDPEVLPGPFDSATLSFGLRYVDDPVVLLERVAQRLRPGGRLVLLEFCVPHPGPISTPASFYFFKMMPTIAGWLGTDRELYDYLCDSTRAMGHAEDIESRITDAGLKITETKTFGFGLVFGAVAVTL